MGRVVPITFRTMDPKPAYYDLGESYCVLAAASVPVQVLRVTKGVSEVYRTARIFWPFCWNLF